MAGLSEKQQRFVDEYLKEPNATAAAERAGYAHPNQQGPRLLVNVGIKEALAAARQGSETRTQVTADRVVKELALVALLDPADVLDFDSPTGTLRLRPVNEIPESARRALASVKVKRYAEGVGKDAREVEVTEFRFCDKLSALDKLARHLGMYQERMTLEVLLALLPAELSEPLRELVAKQLPPR